MGLKIQTTTAVGLLFAGLLPLIVLFSMFALSTQKQLQQAALGERNTLTARLATEVEGLLESVLLDLDLISSNPLLIGSDANLESQHTELLRLGRHGRFSELALFDEEGFLIAASEDIAVTQDRSPWIRRCVETSGTVVSDPIRFDSGDHLSVVVYQSVSDKNSEVAVVRARIRFDSVWSILDELSPTKHGRMYLVDASANVLYSSERDQIFKKTEEVLGDVPFARLRGNGLTYESDDAIFVGQLVKPRPEHELGREWSLIWTESKEQLFGVLHSVYQQLLVGAGVGLISVLVLVFFIERRLSRPLLAMSDVARQAAQGTRGVRMSRSGSRELCSLSDSFNEMMDRLEENRTQLENLVDNRTSELQDTISLLRQSQKMEAVGLMAGGIAHDFNNLLTAINGNIALAIRANSQAENSSQSAEFLRLAETAGDRAAGVVRKLLAFSRKEELQLNHEDANDLVRETHKIVEHTFGAEIDIDCRLSEEPCGIKADGNQIQQVLMNLCINAKDALGDHGGSITLATNLRQISKRDASTNAPGEYVIVSVSDNGTGISKDKMERIFEPFFTTKAPNKGSGLGLAMCYGIITQHGGWIECESTVGEGTVFTIYLERHELPGSPLRNKETPKRNTDRAGQSGISGHTILLVDDEPPVRAIAEAILSRQGCNILTADNGKEALDLCADPRYDIALVVLDGAMPVLNGQETFAEMARSYPDLPVIICSGNVMDDDSFRSPDGRLPEAFLLKPYQFEQLIAHVEALVGNTALTD